MVPFTMANFKGTIASGLACYSDAGHDCHRVRGVPGSLQGLTRPLTGSTPFTQLLVATALLQARKRFLGRNKGCHVYNLCISAYQMLRWAVPLLMCSSILKETQVQSIRRHMQRVCCAQFPASGEGMMYCTVATMCVTQL